MIKLALIAAALTAAGTTAYVVHDRGDTIPPAAAAAPRQPMPVATRAAPPSATATTSARHAPALQAAATTAQADVPGPELAPTIDRATVERLGLERGPSRGPASAKVTLTVFTDMQCSFCGKALASLDQLVEDNPNKLRIVVKQMPLRASSELLAEAVLAAAAQDKFWELHDLMLAHQDDLSRDSLLALAHQAGLDVPAFRTALDHHTYAAAVAADRAAAAELELQGVPAFVIDGRRVIGAVPVEELRAVIDAALAD
jgi:protein-disulfide isomerase